MIRVYRRQFRFALLLMLALVVRPATAVTIRMDYSKDTSGFFFAGSQARQTLDAVAAFYNSILHDSLSAIVKPDDFNGSLGGSFQWHWTRSYIHPSTGDFTVEDTPPNIAADDYPIFVGARNLSGNTIGVGGPGGFNWSRTGGGAFTAAEQAQWQAIDAAFVSSVERRGEASGFARWGGVLTVDTILPAGLSWHLDYNTQPSGGTKVDLFSVALHEVGHVLGFGNITPGSEQSVWETLIDPATHKFLGTATNALFGGQASLEADNGHWANAIASKTFDTFQNQEAAFDPSLTNGTRKKLTLLDAAGLIDLGWEIDLPTPSAIVPGDYNGDGQVDGLDYSVWRNNVGDLTEADINFAGNGGGVTDADFTFWKTRFGNGMSLGGGGLADGNSTPEPGAVTLAAIALSIAVFFRSRSASRRG